ncbi:FAD-binding oxidoreductase [candidate division KSB1 bacterium]|nr:FAD-binding oxidoreductase [candidate division KSB1 bacterium]
MTLMRIHAVPARELPECPPIKQIDNADEIRDSYAPYLVDESRLAGAPVDLIAFPHSEKQVSEFMKAMSASGTPVTVSGARTGIVGGAVPSGGALLSLEKMDRFLGVRWDKEFERWCVRVQPGMSLDRLGEILESRSFDNCKACINTEEKAVLERFARESNHWFYPVDPTEKSAHIGGTVATNASGGRSYKYGQTRQWVTALRVVLADGTVLAFRRGECVQDEGLFCAETGDDRILEIPVPAYAPIAVKNAAGYYVSHPMDCMDFFIGSEGTLGILTEIELALARKPERVFAAVTFFQQEADALDFVKKVREAQTGGSTLVQPLTLEYFDGVSLDLLREKSEREGPGSHIPPFGEKARAAIYFEQDYREQDLDSVIRAYEEILNLCHSSTDQTWGAMSGKEREQITEFRHALPESINTLIGQRKSQVPNLHKIGTDFAVADDNLDDVMRLYRSLLDEAGFEYAVFGHIGENHLHVNILPRDEKELQTAKALYLDMAGRVVAMGGTVSGEHGIGKIKKPLFQVMYPAPAIAEMRRIKNALDPSGLLNPGTLF